MIDQAMEREDAPTATVLKHPAAGPVKKTYGRVRRTKAAITKARRDAEELAQQYARAMIGPATSNGRIAGPFLMALTEDLRHKTFPHGAANAFEEMAQAVAEYYHKLEEAEGASVPGLGELLDVITEK